MDDLNLLLQEQPTEIFCLIWKKAEIYDYEDIKKFAKKNPNLIPQLDACLNRVDINGEVSRFDSLENRINILVSNSPDLKEINLSNFTFDRLNILPKVKDLRNIRINEIEKQTTRQIFKHMKDLYQKYNSDFCIDISSNDYHLKYDYGTFMFDTTIVNVKRSEIKDLIQSLRPHTIETYGLKITENLVVSDSVKNIHIFERESKSDIFSIYKLLSNNKKYDSIGSIENIIYKGSENAPPFFKMPKIFDIYPKVKKIEYPFVTSLFVATIIDKRFPNVKTIYLKDFQNAKLSWSRIKVLYDEGYTFIDFKTKRPIFQNF